MKAIYTALFLSIVMLVTGFFRTADAMSLRDYQLRQASIEVAQTCDSSKTEYLRQVCVLQFWRDFNETN